MIKAEWLKLFKTKKMLISVIAVLFVPVMYAGMFLWAFWDPYANLESLPVAIVNEDTGANLDGEQLQLGDKLVDKLVESQQFKFVEVDADKADEALLDRDYYILIKIPENFSEHATTLLEDEPEKLVIDYIPNEGFNFLGAQIGDTAMERIKSEVNSQVSATYAEKLFASITKLGDGFTEASDGASKIDTGANDLKGYLDQLASSTVELSDGSDELAEGASKAAEGASQLAGGVEKIADGSSKLAEGANSAATGASTLSEGIAAYTDGVAKVQQGEQQIVEGQQSLATNLQALAEGTAGIDDNVSALADGSANVSDGISQLATQLEAIIPMLPAEKQTALKTALTQLQAGSQQVSGGLSQLAEGTAGIDDKIAALSNGAASLNEGQQKVASGVNQLAEKSAALVEGANTLAQGNSTLAEKLAELAEGSKTAVTGANELATGLNSLVAGTTKLTDGTTLLAEKSGELAEGSSTLAEGTTTLAEKLQEASEQVDVNPTEDTYDMVGSPVEVEKEAVNHVPNYGTGFAPYFISLGLFVGALLISIVFPFVEPAIMPKNSTNWFISKVSILAVVGVIQALITVAIVVLGLGLEVDSMSNFILTCIITSFTFLAMVQLLVTVLGDPGRFVAIIILILQLTTSAGTFPLELVPEKLHFFNSFLPMTFSVQGLKAAISTGDTSYLLFNWGILGAVMIGCLVLTFGYFALIFKKRYSKQTAEA